MNGAQKKYLCGHCNKLVSKTLYFKHKKLYYDPQRKTWKDTRIPPPVSPDDEFFLYNPSDAVQPVPTSEGNSCDSEPGIIQLY